ncbi:MAG: hypothetical protein ACREXW_13770 [Gammaproteobacteria bacterium]
MKAWGLALRPAGVGGQWWIANTDSGTVVTYMGDTDTTTLFQDALKAVRVEPALPIKRRRRPARSSAARISSPVPAELHGRPHRGPEPVPHCERGRQPPVLAETGSSQAQRMRSFTIAVNGESGSVYKGLAVTPFSSGNRL